MPKIRHTISTILLWSQKYTKTDMHYVAGGSFWLSVNQTVNAILTLALIIGFANLLPKETYGTYRYILSLAGILNIFTLTGMNSAVMRGVAAGNNGVFIKSVKYQLRWNIFLFATFITLSSYYFFKENSVLAVSFLILGVFTPLTSAFNTFNSFLMGKKQFRLANVWGIFSTVVYVTGMFAILLLAPNVPYLIAAYAITIFLTTCFFYFLTLKKFRPPAESDDVDTIKYGRKLSFIAFLGPISSEIDKVVLAQFWGPAQLATYAFAMAIPSRIVPSLKKFMNIALPKFATKNSKELDSMLSFRIFQGMLVGSTVTILYILSTPFIFHYLLPQYMDGLLYSQLLSISFIFALPTRYLGLLFESQKLSSHIFINTLINSSMAIILYVILGIYGGVIGLVIAYISWSFLGMIVNLVSWQIRSSKQ